MNAKNAGAENSVHHCEEVRGNEDRSGPRVCTLCSHQLTLPRAASNGGRSHIAGGWVEGEKAFAYGNNS